MDPRDRFIHAVAPGRTFADVGGLWGTVNERATVAHAAGASDVTMLDLAAFDHEHQWWQKFEARCQERHVGPVHRISGDVMQLARRAEPPRFDVVHCSGILYHIPDQFQFLRALRTITREHLILTSSITETCISNEAGELRVPEGGALLLPALSPAERAVLKAHWWPTLADGSLGLTRDIDAWNLDDYGPWWWLPTTTALARMCQVAGFEVREVEHLWNGHAATLLLSVAGGAATRTGVAA
jgi:hypothetical protein